jgi:hypothetical protein
MTVSQLAFAVGGLMSFSVRGRYEDATTQIREFADTITSPDELVGSDIGDPLPTIPLGNDFSVADLFPNRLI